MNKPNAPSPNDSLRMLLASFGEPEVVYSPAPALTPLGVSVGLIFATGALAGALSCDEGINARLCLFALGWLAVGLVTWIWRLRKERVLICPKGLILFGAWRTQAIPWSAMTAVFVVCYQGTDTHEEVTVVSPTGHVPIRAWNIHAWREMLKAVADSARRHGVLVRTEFRRECSK